MVLAEECRQVGRDGIAELLQLRVPALLQLQQVLGEAADSQSAQAPNQTAVDQLALGFAQGYAVVAPDQLHDLLKILVGKSEFAPRHAALTDAGHRH